MNKKQVADWAVSVPLNVLGLFLVAKFDGFYEALGVLLMINVTLVDFYTAKQVKNKGESL